MLGACACWPAGGRDIIGVWFWAPPGAARGVAIPGGADAPAGGDGRLRRGRAGAVRPRPRARRARSPANTPASAPVTSLAFANVWMLCPPLISPATAGTGEPYHAP